MSAEENARERLRTFLAEIPELPDWYGQTKQPIDVHSRNSLGDTPLHVAATQGNLAAVRDLLAAGADPNAQGEHGYTPLHEAVEQAHLGIIRLLIARGASKAIGNNWGETAIDLAISRQDQNILEILNEPTA